MKKGRVYKITCVPTGESYIGKTRSTQKQRWYQHCSDAKKGYDTALHKAIREYGSDAFTVETLAAWDDISDLELAEEETRYQREHNTHISEGGLNVAMKGESTLPVVPKDERSEIAESLQSEIKRLVGASMSENTKRAYTRALCDIDVFLAGRELTDVLLAAHITALHESGKSPSTISQSVAAVKWRLKQTQKVIHTPLADTTLAGIRREGKDRGRGQVDGLTWADVERVCAFAESDRTVAGLRDSAMIRLMSDCLLRVSEVVALNCGDIEDTTVVIAVSKTDQTGIGESLYVCEKTRKILQRYRDAAGITRGAVFRRIRRGDKIQPQRLTAQSARLIIKKRADAAGVDGLISGHSLRVGSAVSLAQAGASVVDMQVAGRWKSAQMPAHYAKAELAERGAIARYKDGKR